MHFHSCWMKRTCCDCGPTQRKLQLLRPTYLSSQESVDWLSQVFMHTPENKTLSTNPEQKHLIKVLKQIGRLLANSGVWTHLILTVCCGHLYTTSGTGEAKEPEPRWELGWDWWALTSDSPQPCLSTPADLFRWSKTRSFITYSLLFYFLSGEYFFFLQQSHPIEYLKLWKNILPALSSIMN